VAVAARRQRTAEIVRKQTVPYAPHCSADLVGILAEDQFRLVIHPETVNRYAC
jgi:hypothetical protein